MEVVTQTDSRRREKRSLIPLLTFLFVVSYSMMTYLVWEQAKTIENQRGLIQALFGDSLELTSMKGKQIQERNAAKAKADSQAPGVSKQSAQERGKTAPENKAKRHNYPKPPQAASDKPDERRALTTI